MLIDTHCHIDAPAFDNDRDAIVEEARRAGVADALICSGFVSGFEKTRSSAHAARWHYTLGIHPLFLPETTDTLKTDIAALRIAVEQSMADASFAGVGEIGLDGFEKKLDWERQILLLSEQLKIARDFDLPVSVHARHAVDATALYLRRSGTTCGVIHAFNGSEVQARRFLSMGFKLGFGGALLYSGSLRIRRIFKMLSDEDFVLETDAPDMPSPARRESSDNRTHVSDIAWYAAEAARIRNSSVAAVLEASERNATAAFPRLVR